MWAQLAWPPLCCLYGACVRRLQRRCAERNVGAHVYADEQMQQRRMPPAQALVQDAPPVLASVCAAPSSYSSGVAPAGAPSGERAKAAPLSRFNFLGACPEFIKVRVVEPKCRVEEEQA